MISETDKFLETTEWKREKYLKVQSNESFEVPFYQSRDKGN